MQKSYLVEYCNKILSSEINACKEMKMQATILLDRINNPQKYKYKFDLAKGQKPIEFIETYCKQAEGDLGAPLKLELFQKARYEAIFGFVDEEGYRQFREVLIVEGRKNGKTTECAGTEGYLLTADKEGSPEVYNIATKLDQAKKGFDAVYKMIKQSPALKKRVKKRQSDLYCSFNMGTIKALASNSNSLDGLNAHAAIIDELAAIKNRDIYDLMKQSMSFRKQPLLFCITTNGFIRNNIYDAQYEYAMKVLKAQYDYATKGIDSPDRDESFIMFIYKLDSKDEWDKEDCWIKANPGLGSIKKIETLRQYVQKAKSDASFKATVMVKDFNMIENSESAWLEWDEIENDEVYDFKEMNFNYGIGGFDAADTTDLNAATVLCMKRDSDKIYRKSMYWIPSEVMRNIAKDGTRRERDSAPYILWEKQGRMRTYEGNKVDKRVFLEWFKELRDEEDLYITKIGYDPWHIDDTLLREFKAEFGDSSMIPIRQGVKTLSQPMKELRADLGAKKIIDSNNPIDKWCLANTAVKSDINGNIQPVKLSDARKRIDGTIALINAYIVLNDNMDEYKNIIN